MSRDNPTLPLVFTPAPFSNNDTSREAAEQIAPHLERLEAMVLTQIREFGGMASHEAEVALGLPHTTVSARIRGLVLKGLLRDSGLRRKTPAGRKAIVWR